MLSKENSPIILSYADNLHDSHAYFLDHKELLPLLPQFMQEASVLFSTGNTRVRLDQKEPSISIPELTVEDRRNTHVVIGGMRVAFPEAVMTLASKHTALLPITVERSCLQAETISTNDIFLLMCDIVGALNIYTLSEKKRGQIKPWKIRYKGEVLVYDPSKKKEVVADTAKAIVENINTPVATPAQATSGPEFMVDSYQKFIDCINSCSIPFLIYTSNSLLKVDKLRVKAYKDFSSPEQYKIHTGVAGYISLPAFIVACQKKWPAIFGECTLPHSGKLENGEKEKFYKAFIQAISTLYLINTKHHLHFQYEDGKDVEWIQVVRMNLKLVPAQPKEETDTSPQPVQQKAGSDERTHHKKRVKRNSKLELTEANTKKEVNVALFMSLNYKQPYAETLYAFCKAHIMKITGDETFTVQELVTKRQGLSARDTNLLATSKTDKYAFFTINRILEQYLADTLIGRKDQLLQVKGKKYA